MMKNVIKLKRVPFVLTKWTDIVVRPNEYGILYAIKNSRLCNLL